MTSFIPTQISGRRLLLISAGLVLYANSALAVEPVLDPQEQARQFILARPNFALATVAARDNGRIDPQEQARRVILAKPNFPVAADSKTQGLGGVAAQRNGHLDPQEQARQFIRPSRISG
jgi:hypothetical protein